MALLNNVSLAKQPEWKALYCRPDGKRRMVSATGDDGANARFWSSADDMTKISVEQPHQVSHVIHVDVLVEIMAEPENAGKVDAVIVARLLVDPSFGNFVLRFDGANYDRPLE
jgi:hypothetical protein